MTDLESSEDGGMFTFDRLCFCTKHNNYQHLIDKEGDLEVLHLYEIIEYSYYRGPETAEGPFSLRLIKTDNPGKFPVIYELQDESFDKHRPRNNFHWRVRPPGFDDAALESRDTQLHLLSASNPYPDDTDLSGCQFHYYKKIFSGIDDDLSEEEKKNAVHLGNGGIGHWGINPCCRIKVLL